MLRLLIVDDEIASIKIVRKFLDVESLGIERIDEVENGADALPIINSASPPDIVITDMEMPMMNGVSLLKYLKDCHQEIPVVVISGYYDFLYTHAAIQAGVQEYLLKPIDPEELNRAVRKCRDMVTARKLLPLDAPPRYSVDPEAYRQLLQAAERAVTALDLGRLDAVGQELQVASQALPPDTSGKAGLIARAFTDALMHYCAMNQLELPKPAAQEPSTLPQAVKGVKALYEEVGAQVAAKRQPAVQKDVTDEVRRYIQDHYRETLSLEPLADRFFIRKRYLATLFQSKYGETIGQYIMRLKLEDAQRQLAYSDSDIYQIALSVGFQDAPYFNRQFKRMTGVSPSQYRRERRG